jgi:uncharacterized DUF497 family protein
MNRQKHGIDFADVPTVFDYQTRINAVLQSYVEAYSH